MALAQRAGESLLTLGEIEPIESVVEKLRRVTADDVMRVAQRVIRREKTAIALVGPEIPEEPLATYSRAGLDFRGRHAANNDSGKGWQGRYPFAGPVRWQTCGASFLSPATDLRPNMPRREALPPHGRASSSPHPSSCQTLPESASTITHVQKTIAREVKAMRRKSRYVQCIRHVPPSRHVRYSITGGGGHAPRVR